MTAADDARVLTGLREHPERFCQKCLKRIGICSCNRRRIKMPDKLGDAILHLTNSLNLHQWQSLSAILGAGCPETISDKAELIKSIIGDRGCYNNGGKQE